VATPQGVIANAASVLRREVVVVDALVSPASGAAVQSLHDGRVAFAVEAPALGLGALQPSAVAAADGVVVTERSFTNGLLAMRWNLEGSITSIIDVRAGRELLPSGRTIDLELAPDHPIEYDAWDVEEWTRGLGSPIAGVQSVDVVDGGPLLATLRVVRTFGASSITQSVTMRAGSARLDLAFEIDWQENEQLLSLMVPLDVHVREAACDIQFGHVMRPTHASNSWDAAKFEVCAHRYVDMAEPGFGVAVLNDGRFGHGVQDGGIRVSLLRATKYPDPTADHGRHRVTISVLPHGPGLYDVLREAEALNTPLRVMSGAAAKIAAPLVEVDHPGVQVSAVKRADDGSGDLIVRLYEACGARTPVTIRRPMRIDRAERCNLLEDAGTELDTSDGIVTLTLRPFELVTLRLG